MISNADFNNILVNKRVLCIKDQGPGTPAVLQF